MFDFFEMVESMGERGGFIFNKNKWREDFVKYIENDGKVNLFKSRRIGDNTMNALYMLYNVLSSNKVETCLGIFGRFETGAIFISDIISLYDRISDKFKTNKITKINRTSINFENGSVIFIDVELPGDTNSYRGYHITYIYGNEIQYHKNTQLLTNNFYDNITVSFSFQNVVKYNSKEIILLDENKNPYIATTELYSFINSCKNLLTVDYTVNKWSENKLREMILKLGFGTFKNEYMCEIDNN